MMLDAVSFGLESLPTVSYEIGGNRFDLVDAVSLKPLSLDDAVRRFQDAMSPAGEGDGAAVSPQSVPPAGIRLTQPQPQHAQAQSYREEVLQSIAGRSAVALPNVIDDNGGSEVTELQVVAPIEGAKVSVPRFVDSSAARMPSERLSSDNIAGFDFEMHKAVASAANHVAAGDASANHVAQTQVDRQSHREEAFQTIVRQSSVVLPNIIEKDGAIPTTATKADAPSETHEGRNLLRPDSMREGRNLVRPNPTREGRTLVRPQEIPASSQTIIPPSSTAQEFVYVASATPAQPITPATPASTTDALKRVPPAIDAPVSATPAPATSVPAPAADARVREVVAPVTAEAREGRTLVRPQEISASAQPIISPSSTAQKFAYVAPATPAQPITHATPASTTDALKRVPPAIDAPVSAAPAPSTPVPAPAVDARVREVVAPVTGEAREGRTLVRPPEIPASVPSQPTTSSQLIIPSSGTAQEFESVAPATPVASATPAQPITPATLASTTDALKRVPPAIDAPVSAPATPAVDARVREVVAPVTGEAREGRTLVRPPEIPASVTAQPTTSSQPIIPSSGDAQEFAYVASATPAQPITLATPASTTDALKRVPPAIDAPVSAPATPAVDARVREVVAPVTAEAREGRTLVRPPEIPASASSEIPASASVPAQPTTSLAQPIIQPSRTAQEFAYVASATPAQPITPTTSASTTDALKRVPPAIDAPVSATPAPAPAVDARVREVVAPVTGEAREGRTLVRPTEIPASLASSEIPASALVPAQPTTSPQLVIPPSSTAQEFASVASATPAQPITPATLASTTDALKRVPPAIDAPAPATPATPASTTDALKRVPPAIDAPVSAPATPAVDARVREVVAPVTAEAREGRTLVRPPEIPASVLEQPTTSAQPIIPPSRTAQEFEFVAPVASVASATPAQPITPATPASTTDALKRVPPAIDAPAQPITPTTSASTTDALKRVPPAIDAPVSATPAPVPAVDARVREVVAPVTGEAREGRTLVRPPEIPASPATTSEPERTQRTQEQPLYRVAPEAIEGSEAIEESEASKAIAAQASVVLPNIVGIHSTPGAPSAPAAATNGRKPVVVAPVQGVSQHGVETRSDVPNGGIPQFVAPQPGDISTHLESAQNLVSPAHAEEMDIASQETVVVQKSPSQIQSHRADTLQGIVRQNAATAPAIASSITPATAPATTAATAPAITPATASATTPAIAPAATAEETANSTATNVQKLATAAQSSSSLTAMASVAAAAPFAAPAVMTDASAVDAASARTREIAATVNNIVESIVSRILVTPKAAFEQGEGAVVIHLKPEILGGSEIRLNVHAGALVVEISPATQQAAAMAQTALPALTTALSERVTQYHNISVRVTKGRKK